jgi:subtilisin family serine protease
MRVCEIPRRRYPGGVPSPGVCRFGPPEPIQQGMGKPTTSARRVALVAAFALVLCIAPSVADAGVTPALEARLATTSTSQRVPVIVTLRDQVDGARFAGHPAALIAALHREATRTNHQIPLDGPQKVTHFWLVNALSLSASPKQVARLASDPHVANVDLDTRVYAADDGEEVTPQKSSEKGDWGIDSIGARSVWDAYNDTGQGERIGVIATGADPTNPDLAGKIAAWHDFVNGRPTPYDDGQHGTHVAGTLVGGALGGGAVGVAPGATLVVAKALNAQGVGDGSALIAAAQWMMDPDGNPATADYPTVISNSWVSPDATDTWFLGMVQAWRSLGIVPVFAAGNTGGAASIGSPASYSESVAVGSMDEQSDLSSFSAQGPITWNDVTSATAEGVAPGTVVTKPDFVAPGEDIMSTVPGGYGEMSGTSMATPHVAAAVALLRRAAPNMTVDQVIATLKATAKDLGPAGPDNQYGAGEIDVYAAVKSVLGAPPTTGLVKAPPALVSTGKVSFKLTGQGATAFRDRVDGGTWSPIQASPTLSVSLASGRHTVQVQAVATSTGFFDPKGITRVVVVDKAGPLVKVKKSKRGGRTVLTAHVSNRAWKVRASAIRWSGGHRGASVVCSTHCPKTVTVQDGSGAHATIRVASALRA